MRKENVVYLASIAKYFGLSRIIKLGLISSIAVAMELISLIMLAKLFNVRNTENLSNFLFFNPNNALFIPSLIIIFAFGSYCRVFAISFSFKYSFEVLYDLSLKLLDSIVENSFLRKFDKERMKFVLSSKLSDFAVRNLSHFSIAITQIFLIFGYLLVGVILIGEIFLYILTLFLFSYIFIISIFNNQKYDIILFESEKSLNNRFNEIIDYAKWIVINNKYKLLKNEINRLILKISKIYTKKNFTSVLPKTLLDTVLILTISIIFYYKLYDRFELFSAGNLIIILSISLKILPSIQSFFRSYEAILTSKELYVNICSEINYDDNYCNKDIAVHEGLYQDALVHIHNQIINIYGKNISISKTIINKGNLVKISGKSGSGKSLLLETLALRSKFFNIDFSTAYLEAWRTDSCVFIDQDTNIVKLYNHRQLYLSEINSNLLNTLLKYFNFDINILQEYRKLSGGQLQILNIILILSLENKNIYIFDEVFSSLDAKSERLILEYIKLNSQTKTYLLVSHRNDNDDLYDLFVRL
jgi:ABC-type multidrug transport system fused ATPase/permease subunit